MTRCESYPPCFGTIYFPTAPSFPSNLFLRYPITLAPKSSPRILISIKKEKEHMNLIDSIHSIFIIFILILPCQNTQSFESLYHDQKLSFHDAALV